MLFEWNTKYDNLLTGKNDGIDNYIKISKINIAIRICESHIDQFLIGLSYQYIFEQKKSPSEKCEGDYHAYAKQLNGP